MKCLITKLQGIVENDELQKLGEAKFVFEKGKNKKIKIGYINGEKGIVRTSGKGYFTDSSYEENQDISKEISVATDLYLSPSSENLFIGNKYKIKSINGYDVIFKSRFDVLSYMTEADYIKYYGSGDISECATSFANITGKDGKEFYFGEEASGSLTDLFRLFPNLQRLDTNRCIRNIRGHISEIPQGTNLKYINLSNSKVNGELYLIHSANLLEELIIYNCKFITDKTDDLSVRFPNLTRFNAQDSGITGGDLSKMPLKVDQVVLSGTSAIYSWKTTRSSSAYIISMDNVDFGDDLDAMLINQANCVSNISAHSGTSSYATITAKGNRTSASDSAIETLRGKGFTVNVPDAIVE